MYLLIPGRHQLITQFQFDYLQQLIANGLQYAKDIYNREINSKGKIDAIIFPITSANHSNTRRNPLPFYLRAISIEAMAKELSVPVYIYGIDDVGDLSNFASYTLKRVKHESDGQFDCTPANTLVICSTPVLRLYEQLGFNILPAELKNIDTWQHHTEMPWDVVERVAATANWRNDLFIQQKMHTASFNVWSKYRLGEKVQLLFKDDMISSDGDLTETRDYNVYVRQMDDIAELKYKETATFIQPGRIGDIGCAVGSWIKLACKDEQLRESDFYGIEVSRHLFEICRQRKENNEFENPFVFFSQKNAVTGLVFEPNSMNSIHTSSLTHEIESYGSRKELIQFIKNRYEELAPGGVWINRDVVAPFDKEKNVLLLLNNSDGSNENVFKISTDRHSLSLHLQSLSTYARFIRFAKDFRAKEGYQLSFTEKLIDDKKYISLKLSDAAEFLSRKDYTDNWESEMHETFCFWDFEEWKEQLTSTGFIIQPSSSVFCNEWIVENRLKNKATLFTIENGALKQLDYPVSHMILVAKK
ncbi:MAG: transferase [Ferruginibacter sp.]